jgi:hypothetical protein
MTDFEFEKLAKNVINIFSYYDAIDIAINGDLVGDGPIPRELDSLLDNIVTPWINTCYPDLIDNDNVYCAIFDYILNCPNFDIEDLKNEIDRIKMS